MSLLLARLGNCVPGSKIVDDQLDALVAMGHTADLVEKLAIPIPSKVICELLGVSLDDQAFFQTCTKNLVSIDANPAARQAARADLTQYFSAVIAGESPVEDGLLRRHIERDKTFRLLSHTQMVGLANVLIVGGHETTANMIALGILTLLENSEQRDLLIANPERVGAVVGELMRYLSIADQVTCRAAIEDIRLNGVTIPAGDGIIALTASGNHDARVFADAHCFDAESSPHPHLGFGHGIHRCIGQHLANIELEIVSERLFQRLPNLRVTTQRTDLAFKDSLGVFGLHRMPVAW